MMAENTYNSCRYCGTMVLNDTVCFRCREKLPLVRKLLKIANELKEREGNELIHNKT
jgi:ribosomal protein L32